MAYLNGVILDEIQTAQQFAPTMTWKGKNPVIKLSNRTIAKVLREESNQLKEHHNNMA